MFQRSTFYVINAVIFLILFCTSTGFAALLYIDGNHEVKFQFPNFIDAKMPPFISYSNNGFSQKIEKDDIWQTISLAVNLETLSSVAPYPVSKRKLPDGVRVYLKPSERIQSDHDRINRLRKRLIKESGAKTVADVVRAVVVFAKSHVKYNLLVPQDARTALEMGQGSCVGISCLSIALLRNAGIPARSILGYNPPGYNWGQKEEFFGVEQTGGGFHMWMEVYYPDAGWVFCDPANSLNHVDVYHWVMEVASDETVNPHFLRHIGDAMKAARTSIEPIEEQKNLRISGIKSDVLKSGNIYARFVKNDSVQTIGSLEVTISSKQTQKPLSQATLRQYIPGTQKFYIHQAGKNGEIHLPALETGNYEIQALASGHALSEKKIVSITRGQITHLTISLDTGGEIECFVRDHKKGKVTQGNIILWQGQEGIGFPLDEEGKYVFRGLKPGTYSVSVRKSGFQEKMHRITLRPGRSEKLTIIVEEDS